MCCTHCRAAPSLVTKGGGSNRCISNFPSRISFSASTQSSNKRLFPAHRMRFLGQRPPAPYQSLSTWGTRQCCRGKGDAGRPTATPTCRHPTSGATLDLHQRLRAVLALAFPFRHLACFLQSQQQLPPIPGPPNYPSGVTLLTERGIMETATEPAAGLPGRCWPRWDNVFWGGWAGGRRAVPAGAELPPAVIGSNNPCPWSALKNNPAPVGLEVRPEPAASKHPGREVGSRPRTSTGPGPVAGCCCHGGTRPTPRSARLLPAAIRETPLDFLRSHWEVVLANVSYTREAIRHSLARQSNAMGMGPLWDHHLETHQVFYSPWRAPSQRWDGQRDPWTSWTPWKLATFLGEQHTPAPGLPCKGLCWNGLEWQRPWRQLQRQDEGHLRACSRTDGADGDTRQNSADTRQQHPAVKGAERAPPHPRVVLGKHSGPCSGQWTAQEAVGVSIQKLAEVSARSPKAILLLLDG